MEKEQYFIKTFINKKNRDRLLYEFTNVKKRYAGISRFCHQSKQLLDNSKIILEGKDIERNPQFIDFIDKHDEITLLLSPDHNIDEQYIYLKDALSLAVMSLDAAIIIGNSYAIVFGEAMKGGRDKYLLSE